MTPLVGREEELDLLLRRWSQTRDGEGQVVLLSGEPGIGKSRILRALRERLEAQGVQALRFQCSPYHVNSALWPVVDNFERTLKFIRDEITDSKLDKLEALIVTHYGRPLGDVRFVASILSIPSEGRYGTLPMTPQKHKDETLRTLIDLTEAAAQLQPSVMLFEDAHWADPTTLELLDLLIDRVKTVPLLVVLTHRPEFQSRWSEQGHVGALNLSNLTGAQSAAIVSMLAGGKALPAALLEQILTRTDGVPLFVEELTKSILESGELKDAGDRYHYDGSAHLVTIPATLRDSLMARLDRFMPVKEIAQIGAAIGRAFSYDLIATVAPMPQVQLEEALAQLSESGLAFRRGTPPDAIYTFKHALVQDAAYGTLLRSKRLQLHASIAAALEAHFPRLVESEPERLARHFSEAGLPDRAVGYWSKAADHAARSYAVAEAIETLNLGLADIDRLDPGEHQDRLHLDFTDRLAQTVYLQGRFRDSLDILKRDEVRLGRVADPALTGTYNFWLQHMYNRIGNFAAAHRHATASMAAAELAGDAVTLGKVLAQGSFTAWGEGRPPVGVGLGRRAAEVLAPTADHYWHGMAYFYIAMNQIHLGDTEPAAEAAEAARRIGKEIADARVTTYGTFVKGYALTAGGAWEVARGLCEEAVNLAPEQISRAYASAVLGYNNLVAGEPRDAINMLQKVVEDFAQFPFPPWESLFAAKLAEAWLCLGDVAYARHAAERAVTVAEGCGFMFGAGWARRALGRVAMAEGRLAAGGADLDRAREIFRGLGARLELEKTSRHAIQRTASQPLGGNSLR